MNIKPWCVWNACISAAAYGAMTLVFRFAGFGEQVPYDLLLMSAQICGPAMFAGSMVALRNFLLKC